MDIAVRRRVTELMDQPGLDERLHHQALGGLRRVNWISGSSKILWPPIRDLARTVGHRPLSVLDIGCGGGDITIAVARRAKRAGIDVRIAGCDISPTAVRYARRQAEQAQTDVRFFELDALTDPLPDEHDVLMCSLLLHHLEESSAIALLKKMSAAARHMVLVNDLRRTQMGYWLAWWGCRLLTRSRIVHTDGPLSVAAAFTVEEATRLAQQAGMESATVCMRWPQRFLLEWRRR